MDRFSVLFALVGCLLPVGGGTAEDLAMGQLLVASHELEGPNFAQSVVLLLHYDENGAIGLIVNRPMGVAATDAAPELEFLDRYNGPLYLGGPVAVSQMRALLHTDDPLDGAARVFEGVYLTTFDEALLERLPADASRLRFYVGYAGWSPGQLEHEIERGSWHVRQATVESVFAEDENTIWQQLVPPLVYRATNQAFFDAHE